MAASHTADRPLYSYRPNIGTMRASCLYSGVMLCLNIQGEDNQEKTYAPNFQLVEVLKVEPSVTASMRIVCAEVSAHLMAARR